MGEIDRIIENSKLENLSSIVSEHDRQIKSMNSTVVNMDSKLGEIHTALLGDLKTKGIVSEHRETVEYISACKKRKELEAAEARKSRVDWSKWGFRFAAGCAWAVLMVKMFSGKAA